MAYTKYSLTPANNNAAPPDGAPEGMLPSAVNDTMRDMMAQIRDCGDGIRGGTYTMTAPVITGGSINGAPVGAGTASTGAFSTLAYTGTLTGGTGVVNLGSGQFYKDASGNVGIGTTGASTVRTFIKSAGADSSGWALYVDNSTGTNIFNVRNDGLIDAPKGQIKFPATQSASSDANTLDDYEEGTWTPTLTFGGGSVGITYNGSYRLFSYTKIGRLVTVTGILFLSNKGSSTGAAQILGLPFATASTDIGYIGFTFYAESLTYSGSVMGRMDSNNGAIDLYQNTEAGSFPTLTNANFANNTQIRLTFSYVTNN
jgi:hypothetical protein